MIKAIVVERESHTASRLLTNEREVITSSSYVLYPQDIEIFYWRVRSVQAAWTMDFLATCFHMLFCTTWPTVFAMHPFVPNMWVLTAQSGPRHLVTGFSTSLTLRICISPLFGAPSNFMNTSSSNPLLINFGDLFTEHWQQSRRIGGRGLVSCQVVVPGVSEAEDW